MMVTVVLLINNGAAPTGLETDTAAVIRTRSNAHRFIGKSPFRIKPQAPKLGVRLPLPPAAASGDEVGAEQEQRRGVLGLRNLGDITAHVNSSNSDTGLGAKDLQ